MPRHDYDPIARRRAKREAARRRNMLIVAAATGGMALLAGLMLVTATLSRHRPGRGVSIPIVSSLTGPSPASEGVEWNHADLLNHLNSRGMSLILRPDGKGNAIFMDKDPWMTQRADAGSDTLNEIYSLGCPYMVRVAMYESPKQAKDAVGTAGENGYHWGRFVFYVQTEGRPLLERIKKALD